MNRLYVFAIGGSGERVMRSLVMMLTAGVDVKAHEIVPVFIDNDQESDALSECKNLISYYNSSSNQMGLHSQYDNELSADHYPSFAHVRIASPIVLDMSGAGLKNLETVIGNIGDSPAEQAIREERDLLFSSDDLQMPLTVGFVGNPNIGSLVLYGKNFQHSDYKNIVTQAGASDGVIVVGSLFGGTGAAGFPLVVNEFTQTLQGANRPLVGGVAILPYFKTDGKAKKEHLKLIDTDKYDVHSETFDAKTRAALMYYDDNMTDMDYLYYVGTDKRQVVEHCVGGENQSNPSNIIEILAAQSIIDFAAQEKSQQQTDIKIVYKRPIWGVDDHQGNISNLNCVLSDDLRRSIVKFQLMKYVFEQDAYLKHAIENNMAFVKDLGFTITDLEAIIDKRDITQFPNGWGLKNLFVSWNRWLKQLADDKSPKVLNLIGNSSEILTDRNITSKSFYTDNGDFGIADTEVTGVFTKKTVAKDPKILDRINRAYTPITGANDKNKLPYLLQAI